MMQFDYQMTCRNLFHSIIWLKQLVLPPVLTMLQ